MAKSLDQIQKQISKLQQQAEALKAKEKAGVIERIKVAIAHYGLTAADLGLDGRRSPKAQAKAATPAERKKSKRVKKASPKTTPVAKYSDGAGNSWSGRGPRPAWFKAAVEAGKQPEDLLIKDQAQA